MSFQHGRQSRTAVLQLVDNVAVRWTGQLALACRPDLSVITRLRDAAILGGGVARERPETVSSWPSLTSPVVTAAFDARVAFGTPPHVSVRVLPAANTAARARS